jgi:hypothetical protein
MLAFLIPLKSPKTARSWPHLCELFERTVRSVCAQTSQNFEVIVVCNEIPDTSYRHANLSYLRVDFPVPKPNWDAKNLDKDRKTLAGLVALRAAGPSHVMKVDADDCISNRIAEFVGRHPDHNGWYIKDGYEYDDGSENIFVRNNRFNEICGTSNIINYRLFNIPDTLPPYDEIVDFDRFLGGHCFAKPDLEERGTPLDPLPFSGAIYIRDPQKENMSAQRNFFTLCAISPREALRGVKKRVVSAYAPQKVTRELADEFGLYPLGQADAAWHRGLKATG